MKNFLFSIVFLFLLFPSYSHAGSFHVPVDCLDIVSLKVTNSNNSVSVTCTTVSGSTVYPLINPIGFRIYSILTYIVIQDESLVDGVVWFD